ncbi:MAG: oligosaccharide flippase family protein [Flavobacteriaceae bacterium]|nr:oligosaccharide flippase family protein [Flavobacteriaceae bacterium]
MDRKKILTKNISLGVLYKFLSLILVFTTIPNLLNYLEVEQYGIWVTIFSLINIVLFIDGGIGNGLKTKLSEAISLKDYKLAKTYITTAYISIGFISIILFLIGSLFIYFLKLQNVFNTDVLTETELKAILYVTLFLVVTGFVLNLFKSFYYANQQASKVELAMMLYQLIILLTVFILLNFFTRNLLYVAILYGGSNIIISLIFTLIFFKKNKKLIPAITFFSKNRVKDLMGLSLGFFIIQLSMIVIYTTDSLIITNLLGPAEVTNYDIVYKLFQVIITISVIAQDPFWALYTDAFQKKDFDWIKKTIIRLNKLFVLFSFFIFILYIIAEDVIKFWLQRDLLLENSLLFYMSFFILIRVYGIIYMSFLNAIGIIKLQMWLYVFGALINIPISIFLVKYFNLGSSGVILGTIVSILGLSVFLPFQTYKILKKQF